MRQFHSISHEMPQQFEMRRTSRLSLLRGFIATLFLEHGMMIFHLTGSRWGPRNDGNAEARSRPPWKQKSEQLSSRIPPTLGFPVIRPYH